MKKLLNIFPTMFLHGDVEYLQHKIVQHWNKPSVSSGYEIRERWKKIQAAMEQNIKDMDRIPRDAVRNQEGPW